MIEPQNSVREQLAHNRWGLLATQGYLLGIDIGSYGLRAALVDLQQRSYVSVHQEPSSDEPESTLTEVLALAHGLLVEHGVEPRMLVRVGVGFGGPLNARAGTTLPHPRKIGWEQFPLQQRLEQSLGAVTLIDNDANLIALAEATFGAAVGRQNLFYLHLSTGVGGGMVLGGHLHQGATTTAGEIGHAPIIPADATWQGRSLGTLEQHLSIKGLLSRAAELGLQTADLDQIFDGSEVGQQVVAEVAELLGFRLAQVVALLNPELIVLGGIVVRKGGESLLVATAERMRRYIVPPVSDDVPVVAGVLGHESVALGGIALALDSLQE